MTATSTLLPPAASPTQDRRRDPRVGCGVVARLRLGSTVWSAGLIDVSDRGGCLVMGAGGPLQTGMALLCDLPGGTAVAEVRSVRPSADGVTAVVGVAWLDAEAGAQEWLLQQVSEHLFAA